MNFEELEKKKFDVILSFHVIEHLPDPINEIKKPNAVSHAARNRAREQLLAPGFMSR